MRSSPLRQRREPATGQPAGYAHTKTSVICFFAVMDSTSPIWLLVASLLSGLVAVLVTLFVRARQDQREIKRDVLRRLAGTRYLLTRRGQVLPSGEPFVALNEVFVVFADEPDVLNALERLRKDGGESNAENIVALIKRMAAAAEVPVNLDDAFIRNPFTPPTV